MRYFRSLAIALSIGLAIPASSQAHAPYSDLPGLLRIDSTAWQRVLVYITSQLSTELVRAAADTTSQPWIIRLPDREPQRALIGRQLRTLRRARARVRRARPVSAGRLSCWSPVRTPRNYGASDRLAAPPPATGLGVESPKVIASLERSKPRTPCDGLLALGKLGPLSNLSRWIGSHADYHHLLRHFWAGVQRCAAPATRASDCACFAGALL
jgi:hypothetical protein